MNVTEPIASNIENKKLFSKQTNDSDKTINVIVSPQMLYNNI